MKFTKVLLFAVASLAALVDASAHVSVGGNRTLGTVDNATATNFGRTVATSSGWADATDSNWGDSHHLVAFKFTLASTQNVTITVQRNDLVSQTGSTGIFLPAFSLYQTPLFRSSTHDTGPATRAYLTETYGTGATGEAFTDSNSSLAWDVGESFTDANGNGVYDGPGIDGSGKEGVFQALAPWTIYVDATNGLPMFFDTIIGHAADGTAANYGNAPGINGDGVADGTVTATFTNLAAGDYYLFAGGANFLAQNTEGLTYGPSANAYPTYGLGVTVSAVPEPSTYMLIALAAGGLLALRRFRIRRN